MFRPCLRCALLFAFFLHCAAAWGQSVTGLPDGDHDGLSDALEQRLLLQFLPDFRVGAHDCAGLPARFTPDLTVPLAAAEDGTIYGQVTPVGQIAPLGQASSVAQAVHLPAQGSGPLSVEVHYYHLWARDCGSHGHDLDTEHVAVLLQTADTDPATAVWHAVYWYAGAHESTVCDVSQVARASTLRAQTHGATVWISPGKHGSFLDQRLCARGCGADRCEDMRPMAVHEVINLGEPRRAMNGTVFAASERWPLEAKMVQSNFEAAPLARLEALPGDEIAWYRPGRHPAQGVIAKSALTEAALAGSEDNTAAAISVAGNRTGNALSRSVSRTVHALGNSAEHVEHAVGVHRTPTE